MIINLNDWMQEYGLPKPDMTISGQEYILTLMRPIKASGQIGGLKGGLKTYEQLTDRQIEIVNYIIENETITKKKLANKVGINPSAIQKQIDKLNELGILKRMGSNLLTILFNQSSIRRRDYVRTKLALS